MRGIVTTSASGKLGIDLRWDTPFSSLEFEVVDETGQNFLYKPDALVSVLRIDGRQAERGDIERMAESAIFAVITAWYREAVAAGQPRDRQMDYVLERLGMAPAGASIH